MPIDVIVPTLGESIKQAVLLKWLKAEGQAVSSDEPLVTLETDKANVDISSPGSGMLRPARKEGESVAVGEVIARIEEGAGATAAAKPKPASAPAPAAPPPAAKTVLEDLSPAVRALVTENNLDANAIPATGPGGRLTKQDVQSFLATRDAKTAEAKAAPAKAPEKPIEKAPEKPKEVAPLPPPAPAQVAPAAPPPPPPAPAKPAPGFDAKGLRREPISKIRKRIAETMVQAQHTAAILTTFNEIDMSAIIELRARYKDRFQETHGVGLGFMSFFARGVVLALREYQRVNAFIEGDEIVFHNYVNLGIAVSTERGLAVPVLRNVQDMGLARIESEIKRLAQATRDGKLGLEELSGATFTITNGGVFGSLLSTPILTPPQSGILGMHAIQKRPMAINDKIEIRSMMYVALSYDHRLVDGRDSIGFLVKLKQLLEDPARLLLEI
ncbi:MAG: 2-oxoglutarate dehydrogenase complex dihydrolipoyllysine-residue succinyltransferase [Tepidisphaeraceae bacterium]|jgi:2-oxoglutarate dehydrogenase E2 component (dihydrolipoamide succinyltransferase)